ncbi:hypothetical protein AAX26_01535 [Aliarcobacter thereius]|uniref:Uncharacterized protein n=2 Tax=Aliarcobacter thereius TaxID=544718 RepID=A0A1C0B671_9BACT|nr:hypothetical protein [Aliarcobacter thereius]OCL86402.1 hypothetical protein AAX26_01535 [Aliarcobacter thereius]OCL90087.1 hypothetical protein AAX25_01841 [Aliarcobacter thereius]OCL96313.1 hypothetical protein AA347_01804 [Aliarcobacter thereius LMG 24486]OCL98811.1 hypothetical protein AAX29_01321 [Aliarcobacter thereius]QBF15724.1 putative membrane protein [Aliarcobacter thereius LMG 24486]
MSTNSLDNPFFLVVFISTLVFISIFASSFFIILPFAGILSIAFYRTLKQEYYYSFAFILFAFLIVELNMGLKPFSLALIAYFIYLFIIPQYEQDKLNNYLYILFFYIGMLILFTLFYNISTYIILFLLLAFFLDIIIFGIFL